MSIWIKRQREVLPGEWRTVWMLKSDPAWMIVKDISVSRTSTSRPVRKGMTVYEITHNGQSVCNVLDTIIAAQTKADELIRMERSDKG